MKKKMSSGIIFLILFVFGYIVLFGWPWIGLALDSVFGEEPPKPVARYAKFPFELVYEKNGEIITVKDTIVIEYDGVDWNEGVGKYNKWDRYFLSERDFKKTEQTYADEIELLRGIDKSGHSFSLLFALGSSEYYMGLPEEDSFYEGNQLSPGDIVLSSTGAQYRVLGEQELLEDYGIKIIEKNISPPYSRKTGDG